MVDGGSMLLLMIFLLFYFGVLTINWSIRYRGPLCDGPADGRTIGSSGRLTSSTILCLRRYDSGLLTDVNGCLAPKAEGF